MLAEAPGLLQEPAPLGVRLRGAAALIFIIREGRLGLAPSLFGAVRGLMGARGGGGSRPGPPLRLHRSDMDALPSVDGAGGEDGGNHGA